MQSTRYMISQSGKKETGKAIGLFVLRMLIGWHLLYEDLLKLTDPGWSAAGFLQASQGPFAPLFRALAENAVLLPITDHLNQWDLTVVDALLIAGLFTRLGGMTLLLLYYLSAPPLAGLTYDATAEGNYLVVNKTLIEATALWVLSLFAGHDAWGLDSLRRLNFRPENE